MRSILIAAIVLVVLVVAFVTFLLTQKSSVPVVRRKPATATSLPTLYEPKPGDGPKVGGGQGAWVQAFDKKTGELVNAFRADTFDPPVENKVHVIRPEARFYAKDGQVLTLHASTGDITLAEGNRKGDRLGGMQGQPPSHGRLYDVTLGLLETVDATAPVLTATIPIVEFDNDLLRLDSVPMKDKNGQEIPADRIPVTVRGRDYDFDGQGLLVRYNQRDRRLERLEVAHGQRLVIKNAKGFGPTPGGSPLGMTSPLTDVSGRPIELASADPADGPQISAQERKRRRERREAATRKAAREAKGLPPVVKPTSRPHEIVAYRASFYDSVTITEGGVPVGDADLMNATFTFDKEGQPATRPATAPAAAGPATSPAHRRPTTAATSPAVVQPSSRPSRRVRQAATAPTTQSSGPIEIRWTGKLVVVPQKLAESGLRSTADRIVEFTGKPVHLQRDGSNIVAAYVWAAVEGNRFRAAPDPTTPLVTVRDARGTVLTTESIEADGDDAILHGRSAADMAIGDTDPPKPMRTTWSEFATIHSVVGPGGKRVIERATLRGDVAVRHPQLKLDSDTLALGFAPEAGKDQPQLSTVRADGRVNAAVTGDDGNVQTITAATLDLGTAADSGGSLAVRSMHAHGDVVASDGKQTLKTDDLATTLAATKVDAEGAASGGFSVDTLAASGNVDFRNADGAHATADRLTVDKAGGAQWVTLFGTPARVSDPQSQITGNAIRVDSTGARANIDGPGSLSGSPKATDGKAGQPVHVVWQKSMHYDGAGNAARILGDVNVTTIGSDGTLNKAVGQQLDVTFVDAPTTRPATQASATQAAVTQPTTRRASTRPASSQPFNLAGGQSKQVKMLTLSNGPPPAAPVEVSSLLFDPNDANKLLRRTYLYGPSLSVSPNTDGSPGAMDVPAAGRMLYEDMTDAAPAPAAGQPAPQGGPGGLRGTTAIEWKKSLHYDPAVQKAVLDGDVQVVHKAPGEDPMRLLAPRLIADVSGGATPQGVQLKKVTADRGATMFAKNMRVDSATAEFDPAADRMIARGTARQPVQWFDQTGLSRGSFAEMWWNLKSNQPEKVKDVSVEMNR